MLTFDELLSEVKQRSQSEQLALLEELTHTLRHKLVEDETQTASQSPNHSEDNGVATTKTPEELGWPPGYFETVPGSIPDLEFIRHPHCEH